LVRAGEVSSVEVVQSHLERIAEVNGSVNAVSVVLEDDAISMARLADASPPAGPLHGVPFTVKENIDVVGSATTWGKFADAMPSHDDPSVERLKSAGGIVLGRTNMAEMGLRITTDSPLRGCTFSPWDPMLCTPGSSGGDAVALATGMTPVALGNDLGGSVRSPAWGAGVCALKPTHGRVPSAASIPPVDPSVTPQVMASTGPMSRCVADLRLALEVLNGRDRRDPRSVDVPIDGPPVSLTAALVTDLDVPSEYTEAVRAAGRALQAAGYQVVEATPPDLDVINLAWVALLQLGFAADLPALRDILTPALLAQVEAMLAMPTMSAAAAFIERHRMQREWSEFFAHHTVIVGPVWTGSLFPHDADLDPDTGWQTLLARVRFITPGNLLGIPSTAVPTGIASDGHPHGVQVYADLWRDDLTLTAAQAIEDASGSLTPVDPR
jgi:amidase